MECKATYFGWMVSFKRGDGIKVRQLCRAADAGGMIQAEQMAKIFTDPRRHTACRLEVALEWLGAELIDA